MKKIISLVLVILLVISVSVFSASCGEEPEKPIEFEKNPTTPSEDDKENPSEGENPDDKDNDIPNYDDPSINPGGIVLPPVNIPST